MLVRPIFAGLLAAAGQVPEPSPPAGDVAVQWRAPGYCPDRSALLRGIEARLGRPLRAGELRIDGDVTVHATPPRYRMRLRLRAGSPGEWRTLTAATCTALADATAVLAVTAIWAGSADPAAPTDASRQHSSRRAPTHRPELHGPAGESDGAAATGATGTHVATDTGPADPGAPEIAAAESLPAGSSTPVDGPDAGLPPNMAASAPWTVDDRELDPLAAEALPPSPAPRRGPGGFVRVLAGPEYGALPGVTGAVGLASGLLWRWARLEFHGMYLAPRTATSIAGQLQASLAAGAVHGCARPGRGRIEVPLCGGLELGGMRGAAGDVPEARTRTRPWLAVVAGVGAAVWLGERWSLSGTLQMVAGLARPGFEVRDPGPVVSLFEPRTVTGRLLVGVELRLRDPR